VTDFPIRLTSAEEQLKSGTLDAATVKRAVVEALADVAPLSDLHASAEYRRRVAVSLATQAVADARSHAIGKTRDAN
jgi:carbon-monoxide dehydrogenase medium subunit